MRSAVVFALLVAGSCRQSPPPEAQSRRVEPEAQRAPAVQGPAVVIRTRAGQTIPVRVEVARTDPQRMRGLMHRTQLGEDQGMVFMFTAASQQTFWMRNTLIPLDMIFIRADRTILGIVRNAVPETDDPRGVPGESQYVLEVNGGWCQRHNVNADDRVEFVDVPPAVD